MYDSLIGEKVNVVVSSKCSNMLEYVGTLLLERDEVLELTNVDISYLMLNYQKGVFGGNINRYKDNLDRVVINKQYIISCNKI